MEDKKPIRSRVKEMKVGEHFTLPMTAIGYSTLRTYASEVGLQMDRRYSTKADRINRTFTISRIA